VTAPEPRGALGTSELAWRRWPGLPRLPVCRLQDWPSAVIVAAHAEDGVLGIGGTLAALAAGGARLRLVITTAGETCLPGFHPSSRPAQNAALEALEASRAEVIRLGYPGPETVRREAEIAGILSELTRGFEVCLAPWKHDAQPAHEATGRAAREAASCVLSYPVNMWDWALPGDLRVPWDRSVQVPLPTRAVARKIQAIELLTHPVSGAPAAGHPPPADLIPHFTRSEEYLFF
jgi:LmbE family N-acetylglucosaminyl deacetylase